MANQDGTLLEVVIYDGEGNVVKEFTGDDAVDYVSIVSGETYGKPALIAPGGDSNGSFASPDDRVLYINTRHIPFYEITRVYA